MSRSPTAFPTTASTPCRLIFIVIPLSTPFGTSRLTFLVCRFISRDPGVLMIRQGMRVCVNDRVRCSAPNWVCVVLFVLQGM